MRKVVKLSLLLFLGLLLSSCQVFDSPKPYIHSEYELCGKHVTLIINPNLDQLGVATMKGGKRIIVLREYPVCLKHEEKHICEGYWHPVNVPNVEHCYN